MTSPRILSSRELALRAQREAESLPRTELRTRVPARAGEIGALPPRVSTFHPPRPSLEGLVRAEGHPSRPAGRNRANAPRPRPGLAAPEGVRHFAPPASPADAAARHRLGQDLLRMRSDTASRPTAPASRGESPAPAPTAPTLSDCRRDLAEFRNAMGEFQRARYFGGESRHVEAAAALTRAEAAYHRLYANLPLTPSMSGVLDNLQGRMTEAQERLVTMTPARSPRRRA